MIDRPQYVFEEDEELKAIEFVKMQNPENMKELAELIQITAIWKGYEDFYISERVLGIILDNYKEYYRD